MRHSGAIDVNSDQLTLLVTAAQHDETRALDKLLSTVRPVLFSYFARRVPDDLADDLAQIALIRIVKALPRIDPKRAGGFIGTISHNLLRTAFRRQARDARRVAPSVTPDELESGVTADQEVDLQDLLDAVMRASSRTLTHELRDVVTALLRGQDRADIAATQGISQITVRTRLMRARVILREELGEAAATGRGSPTGKSARTTRLIPE
jgi:RNA polymerase sigma factor (sigma-70 family)